MKCVFITGGSSGIGEGLASALHARGARVVIGGRDEAALGRVAEAHPGMQVCRIDVADRDSIARCADEMASRFPELDALINNAGVQRLVSFASPSAPPGGLELDVEIDTNLRGLVHTTAAFLPGLLRQREARIVQVSSGLGFVPLVSAPIYSATKAAVHSFTVSLRAQLRGTSVRVIELVPPVVATRLHRGQERTPPRAMPLDRFVAAALAGLDDGRDEINVGLARVLRLGARVAPGQFLKVVNRSG